MAGHDPLITIYWSERCEFSTEIRLSELRELLEDSSFAVEDLDSLVGEPPDALDEHLADRNPDDLVGESERTVDDTDVTES